MKAVGTVFGERAVLKLMYSAVIRASESWRGVKVTEFEDAQLRRFQKQLGEEHRRQTSPIVETEALRDQTSGGKAN